jgi:hypothetical protein
MTEEQYEFEQDLTLHNIATIKSHKYAEHILSKQLYAECRQAFKDGFLAGVAYQFTGDSND